MMDAIVSEHLPAYLRPAKVSGQAAFYEDGLAIDEYAIQRGVRPEHIVVMGHSQGSGALDARGIAAVLRVVSVQVGHLLVGE